MVNLMRSIQLMLFIASFTIASISFSVTADRVDGAVGERIMIQAKIVSDKTLKNVQPPKFPSAIFYTLIGTSQNQHESSSIQIINGKMTKNVEKTYLFNYQLRLKTDGTAMIPSINFSYDGTTYQSRPFSIVIGKVSKKEDQFVSVSILAHKKNLFVGEQTVVTLSVTQRQQSPAEVPTQSFVTVIEKIHDVFGQEFSINRLFVNKLTQKKKIINGQPYVVSSLAFSLIPLKEGSYTLRSIPFDYYLLKQVRRQQDPFNDFFGGSFFGGGYQKIPNVAMSNRLTLRVKPLPPKPANFTGAVGSFTMKSTLSKSSVSAGEAVTLSIELKGLTRPGNISDIKLPKLKDFEVFTPEKHTYVDTTNSGIYTRKTFKYLLIPQTEGEKKFEPITWIYFDPINKVYKTLSSKILSLSVNKGKKGALKQTRYLTQKDIAEVGHDIRFIKTPQKLKHQTRKPYKSTYFFLLYPLPFIFLIFMILYRLQATMHKNDPVRVRKQRAYSSAQKRFSALNKIVVDKKPQDVAGVLSDILADYISDKFSFAAQGMTLDELKKELISAKISEDKSNMIIPFLEELDAYRFGGAKLENSKTEQLCFRCKKFVDTLNKKDTSV